MTRWTACLALAPLVALGCGGSGGDPSSAPEKLARQAPSPAAEGKRFLLPSEPAGGKGVLAIRKEAKDGDEVVVAGKVGGSTKPFTENRASFLMVDSSLPASDGCETPWDFCELPKKEVTAARLSVKFVDADGRTIKGGARELFGLAELSQVVVKGKVSRDDKDNVLVVASGIYVRPEAK